MGDHTVNVHAADLQGYASWKNWSFIVSNNGTVYETPIGNITTGENTTIIPENPGETIIDSIQISTKTNLTNATLVIVKLNMKPVEVKNTSANLTIFAFLDISLLSNGVPVQEIDIGSITIKFKVERQWITDQKIDATTIALARYHQNDWQLLPILRYQRRYYLRVFHRGLPGSLYVRGGRIQVVEINPYQSGMPEIPWSVIIGIVVVASILLVIVLFKAGYIYRAEETQDESSKPSQGNSDREQKP